MVLLYNIILISAALVYLLILGTGEKKKQYDKIYVVVFSIVLILLAACRFEKGEVDYYRYKIYFLKVSKLNWAQIFHVEKEVGWAILLKLCSYITLNPQIMFLPCALLTVIPFAWFLYKYSEDAPLSLFVFAAFNYFFTANNATRQYVAIGITLIACHYALKRKLIPFIIFTLLASTIHTSALFFFIMYPLCSIPYTKSMPSIYIILTPIILLAFPFIIDYIQQYIYGYYDEGDAGMGGSNKLGFVLPIVLFLFVIIDVLHKKDEPSFRESLNRQNIKIHLYNLNLHMIGLLFVGVACQVFQVTLAGRFAWYCNIGVCLYIPKIAKIFRHKEKTMVKAILLLFALLYFLIFNALGKVFPVPYYFFWDV